MTKCTILWTRDGTVVLATPKRHAALVDYTKHIFPGRARWHKHGTEYRAGRQWLLQNVTPDELNALAATAREIVGADQVAVEELDDADQDD